MKEYSTELTRMLSELEDPDAKRPTLRRFAVLTEEEKRNLYEGSEGSGVSEGTVRVKGRYTLTSPE